MNRSERGIGERNNTVLKIEKITTSTNLKEEIKQNVDRDAVVALFFLFV